MGQRFESISNEHREFIKQQKIFFVGTATKDGRVNVSPKGMDSMRVIDAHTALWLNATGSGNETSAHVQENSRMTLMFTAFEGSPLILRLYGQAQVYHPRDPEWNTLIKEFPQNGGARQVFKLNVDLVQSSCGFGVPYYDYVGERETLQKWADKKGPDGVEQYWKDKNQVSLDGKPTHILDKNI